MHEDCGKEDYRAQRSRVEVLLKGCRDVGARCASRVEDVAEEVGVV